MSERQFRVLTAVGQDRPGLVHGISAWIHEAGANLEDSRMAVLGGEFAMIVLLSGDDEALTRIQIGRGSVSAELGLELSLRETRAPSSLATRRYALRVQGLDHPGIVDSITNVLARHSINIAWVQTRVAHQPLTGTPVFTLETELQLPPTASLEELSRDLTKAAADRQLEFELDDSPDARGA